MEYLEHSTFTVLFDILIYSIYNLMEGDVTELIGVGEKLKLI